MRATAAAPKGFILHPTLLFIVLYGTRMERSGKPVFDHFFLVENTESWVKLFKATKVLKHGLHDLINYSVCDLGGGNKGRPHAERVGSIG